jgi:hypothetical protein
MDLVHLSLQITRLASDHANCAVILASAVDFFQVEGAAAATKAAAKAPAANLARTASFCKESSQKWSQKNGGVAPATMFQKNG